MAFLDDLKLGPLPDGDVAAIEARYPGFVEAAGAAAWRVIEGRLRKRYPTPIDQATAPEELRQCQVILASWTIYLKRGVSDETSLLADELKAERDRQLEWLAEVANGEIGLIELALTSADGERGSVTKDGPLAYSERSPYEHSRRTAQEARRYGR